ncbi:hypothetical protein Cantr_01134 [Candida viswanathii]|uniref:DUF1977 domain-containing protein n=1 Tax=Candida viswanathii TaxID=5486 RepID=A0A367YHW1_9ASCO|nr:hypothetical protein Cantr_01134 [Candida viswanathii]
MRSSRRTRIKSKRQLRNYDAKVENIFISDKRAKCSREQVHKDQLIEDAYGWFSVDTEKLHRAENYPTPNCDRINTKENVKRFKNILRLNHDITTELNLILLFVDLELEAVFLPNLVEPYVSYIQSINSNFKRFIPCSTLSKDCQLLNCANSFIQPVDGYLLVLWFQSGEANPEPYYVNLMTLKSFRAYQMV